MHGFLGTDATFRQDLNLVVQVTMGVALVVGTFLARKKRFHAHMICQSSVMLLNLVMISLIMGPSFRREVRPAWRAIGHDAHITVAAIHAALGATAELLGLYIVLVAATKILPSWLKFKHYKPWMQTELVLWWVVLTFGIATYLVWYVAPGHAMKAQANQAQPAAQINRMVVTTQNFDFTPKVADIPAGGTIVWEDAGGRHKVVADDGSFESPILTQGSQYEHQFTIRGSFPYHCDFHGDKGGKDMAGVVEVH